MIAQKTYNYKIDEWVIYKPYEFSIPKRAVILWVYKNNLTMYDYEIFIDGEGKIIKVLESSLFPDVTPTY
jgi:hypothetical protein|tara:strand:+ start:514 stop:723 length:210 start_codon:yes stop_codon:yes gene_type:complete